MTKLQFQELMCDQEKKKFGHKSTHQIVNDTQFLRAPKKKIKDLGSFRK